MHHRAGKTQEKERPLADSKSIHSQRDTTYTLLCSRTQVDISEPAVPVKAELLVLPGFGFPRNSWCTYSSLCKRASAAGFRLIMPEMGRSVYARKIYPFTQADYRSELTLTALCDTVLADLQLQKGFLRQQVPLFVLGLSTGARGVAQICLYRPLWFTAAAALSGDYDQTLIPDDFLINAWYGSFAEHDSLWKNTDNPAAAAALFRTPIYLGHGQQDQVVPPAQTHVFYEALKKANPALDVRLHEVAGAGHDYAYWDGELPAIFQFFGSFLGKSAP